MATWRSSRRGSRNCSARSARLFLDRYRDAIRVSRDFTAALRAHLADRDSAWGGDWIRTVFAEIGFAWTF